MSKKKVPAAAEVSDPVTAPLPYTGLPYLLFELPDAVGTPGSATEHVGPDELLNRIGVLLSGGFCGRFYAIRGNSIREIKLIPAMLELDDFTYPVPDPSYLMHVTFQGKYLFKFVP